MLLHCLENLQGTRWLLALSACANQGIVGDDTGNHTAVLHAVVELQPLPPLTPPAQVCDLAVVRYDGRYGSRLWPSIGICRAADQLDKPEYEQTPGVRKEAAAQAAKRLSMARVESAGV